MSLQPDLVKILVCPESKQPLVYFDGSGAAEGAAAAGESFLFCPASRLKYRIDDGIPVMLIDEAKRLSDAEAAELLAVARQRGLANA